MALRCALRAFIIFRSLGSPNEQVAGRILADIGEKIGEEEFNTIVQSEIREIELHGPDVIPEGGQEVEQ